jgi:hypothetical protein
LLPLKIWSNCLQLCRLRSQGPSAICHLDFRHFISIFSK